MSEIVKLLTKAAAPRVSLDLIFPNRLNPNEMGFDKFTRLKEDIRSEMMVE